MSAHTPFALQPPWFVEKHGPSDKRFAILADGTPIAWVDYDDVDRETADQIGTLIAAAPDLLAACEALVGRVEVLAQSPNRQQALDLARAAIAKARGER
jgi:hypothetical protein